MLDVFSQMDSGWGGVSFMSWLFFVFGVTVPGYFLSFMSYWYMPSDLEIWIWAFCKKVSEAFKRQKLSGFIGAFHFLCSVYCVLLSGALLGMFPGVYCIWLDWVAVSAIAFVCWSMVGCMYFSSVSYLSIVSLVMEEVPFLLGLVAGVAEFISFLARPFILTIRFGMNVLIGQMLVKWLAGVGSTLLFWPYYSGWDILIGGAGMFLGICLVGAESAVLVGQSSILVLLLCMYLDEVKMKVSFESWKEGKKALRASAGFFKVYWESLEYLNSKGKGLVSKVSSGKVV